MKCKEIITIIEKDYPGKCALEWDNTGLLAGRDDKEIGRIYVALDASDEVIEEAVKQKADLLVTHHPLIFSGLKSVTNQNFTGNRVLKLLQNDICCYAMHTNYDVKRMGELSFRKLGIAKSRVLEVTALGGDEKEEGIGRIADIEPVTLGEMCGKVKEAFGLSCVRAWGALNTHVKRAAICPGSGKSVIRSALEKGADVLITGDIGHHEGTDAAAQGMAIIDAGHYGVEHIFIDDMKKYFEKHIPEAAVRAADICHPFSVI